jgi:hypothetical protein
MLLRTSSFPLLSQGKELDYEAMGREQRMLAAIIREHTSGRRAEPPDRLAMRAQVGFSFMQLVCFATALCACSQPRLHFSAPAACAVEVRVSCKHQPQDFITMRCNSQSLAALCCPVCAISFMWCHHAFLLVRYSTCL